MTGEISFFRKKFIGGFNRKDVVDYIAKLAKERNEITAARDKAMQEIGDLVDEVSKLHNALEEAKQAATEYRINTLEAAGKTFSDLEGAFTNLRAEYETATAGLCAELEAAVTVIAAGPSILERAGERLAELQFSLEEERASALVGRGLRI